MIARKKRPNPMSKKKLASVGGYASSTITGPKKKPKAKNAKRAKKNQQRAYGEKAKWIRTLPCHFCGVVGFTEAAHSKTGGTGRKADASTLVPMCRAWEDPSRNVHDWHEWVTVEGCHPKSHRIGIQSFLKQHGLTTDDLLQIAADYEKQWQSLTTNPKS